MNKGDIITSNYRNDTTYEVYDETDPLHRIFIGVYDTVERTARAVKEYKEKFPGARVFAYKLIMGE